MCGVPRGLCGVAERADTTKGAHFALKSHRMPAVLCACARAPMARSGKAAPGCLQPQGRHCRHQEWWCRVACRTGSMVGEPHSYAGAMSNSGRCCVCVHACMRPHTGRAVPQRPPPPGLVCQHAARHCRFRRVLPWFAEFFRGQTPNTGGLARGCCGGPQLQSGRPSGLYWRPLAC